jgi:hypothetical protein
MSGKSLDLNDQDQLQSTQVWIDSMSILKQLLLEILVETWGLTSRRDHDLLPLCLYNSLYWRQK